MNALVRKEKWRPWRPEKQFPRLATAASIDAKKFGMIRATDLVNLLLSVSVKAGRGGRGLWRAFLVAPNLVIRKDPHGRGVDVAEEYRSLREQAPLTMFLKF